ncbi:O-antigen ligase family protein [Bythopirellula goksoeyrii]|uniref:O-Antigen ligase n=1 Tax=Bythopirellula goksoeyrii TaxID=1400387 RepID=A0A5B9QRP4_9BACT|nr:O-antigen ligase family protein [Bythopirellula goksoeyrii]QEG36653.1 O-Antigen ligase [Bythopirellula goksoeyrii]
MSTRKSSRTRKRSSSSRSVDCESPISAALLKTVDLGLGAIIFVAPHLFGGRHPLGRLVIVALCVATAIAWFARQLLSGNVPWTRSTAWIVPTLAALVVVFQLVPIPAEWLPTLSPRLQEMLPLWSGANGSELGTWQTLSLAPEETRLALAALVAYGLLFVTAVQRLETHSDILRVMQMIGLSAVGVALFGIAQYFTSNGRFFWFYEYPFTTTAYELKAGFTCRNHFAHFLVLGLAMLVAWVMVERQPLKKHSSLSLSNSNKSNRRWQSNHNSSMILSWLLVTALVLVACTILASLSRGGILAMATVILVATACYARARLLNFNHLAAGVILMVLAMAALSLSGKYSDVSKRLDDFVSQDVSTIDSVAGRQPIWAANLEAIRAGWLTGSGAGTHRFIYPAYLAEPVDVEYTHAENGYLQIATENGLPGVLLLLGTFLTCIYWCASSLRNARGNPQVQIMTGGIAAALAASAVHSLVDFVWFIPACTCTTLLLIAALHRIHQLTAMVPQQEASRCLVAPSARFNLALGVTLSGVWAVTTVLSPARVALEWDAYLRASLTNQRSAVARTRASESRQETLAESERLNGSSMLEHLNYVVQEYPHSARAHARLSGTLLATFEDLQQDSENPMPISQIREAALASSFNSAEQLRDWMHHAFGERSRLLYQAYRHARRAVQLCPLQGESYQCLAELCFLEKPSSSNFQTYEQQGLRVQPCDGELLFAIGKNELLAGNETEALRLWAKAYQGAGKHRDQIIRLSVNWMPASQFVEVFQPEWDSLNNVWHFYKQTDNQENLESLLAYASQQADAAIPAMHPNAAGSAWLYLAKMQNELTGPQLALDSLQNAYLLSPDRFAIRYELGKCLLALQQFPAAESHLHWCNQQIPNNPAVRRDLQNATRGRLQQLARSTQTTIR